MRPAQNAKPSGGGLRSNVVPFSAGLHKKPRMGFRAAWFAFPQTLG
jgi:hypothetical protein